MSRHLLPRWARPARRVEPVERVEERVEDVAGRLEERTRELVELVAMGRGLHIENWKGRTP